MSGAARTFGHTAGDRVQVITLHDRVDVDSVHALHDHLRAVPATAARPLVLDLSAVTLMSTHALSALIAGVRDLNRDRTSVAAVVCAGPVARAVEHAGLPGVQIHATLRGALADAP